MQICQSGRGNRLNGPSCSHGTIYAKSELIYSLSDGPSSLVWMRRVLQHSHSRIRIRPGRTRTVTGLACLQFRYLGRTLDMRTPVLTYLDMTVYSHAHEPGFYMRSNLISSCFDATSYILRELISLAYKLNQYSFGALAKSSRTLTWTYGCSDLRLNSR